MKNIDDEVMKIIESLGYDRDKDIKGIRRKQMWGDAYFESLSLKMKDGTRVKFKNKKGKFSWEHKGAKKKGGRR